MQDLSKGSRGNCPFRKDTCELGCHLLWNDKYCVFNVIGNELLKSNKLKGGDIDGRDRPVGDGSQQEEEGKQG
jgi:hypothetical protein